MLLHMLARSSFMRLRSLCAPAACVGSFRCGALWQGSQVDHTAKKGRGGEQDGGSPEVPTKHTPEEDAKHVRKIAEQAAHDPNLRLSDEASGSMGRLKKAGSNVVDFTKETVHATEAYAKQLAEKALGLEKERTDQEIDQELEDKVRRGMPISRMQQYTLTDADQGRQDGLPSATEDPSQIRGDTIGGSKAHGSTSPEARVGGQPAGTMGKPPADV